MSKRIRIIMAVALTGLALLLFSTRIVLLATGFYLEKKEIDTTIISPDVLFNFDQFGSTGGLLKTYYIRGWALHTGYESDTEKNISIIFKADTFGYEIKPSKIVRRDVAVYYSELNLKPEGLGFEDTFSTIAFKDGTYEMFVKVWETGREASITTTNRHFIKEGNSFKEIFEDDEKALIDEYLDVKNFAAGE